MTAEVQTKPVRRDPRHHRPRVPEGSTDFAEIVGTATTGAAGTYTLNSVGAYDLEFVDDDLAAPTYASTTTADVQVLQDMPEGGRRPSCSSTVTMSISGGDTLHPVLASVVDVNGADIDGLTVTAQPASAPAATTR